MASRRDLLEGAAALAAAGVLGAIGPASAEMPPGPIATDDDVDRMLPSISNWGRWGPDDQLGTLNFITPEMRVAAAARSGPAAPSRWRTSGRSTDATGIRKLTYRNFHYTDPQPDEAGTIDEIGMIYHGYVVTHLDALCHLFTPEGRDGMYNGYPIALVTDAGAAKLGVEVMGVHGIVGRGVLLDIAALKGGPLPLGSIIPAPTSRPPRPARASPSAPATSSSSATAAAPQNSYQLGTGLHPECLPWLHARRVALLSHDGDGDVHPPQPGFARWTEPVHMIAIPYLGMPLICGSDLEAISAACAEEKPLELLPHRRPLALQGRHQLPGEPARDLLTPLSQAFIRP